jgi:signal transduction histidine kinase
MTEVPDTRSLVQEIEERLEEIIWHTRSLTSELGPPLLYQLGLEAALEWLADYMKEQYGVLTKVKFTGKSEVADEELRVFLFRTAQELLMNVSKHAKTDTAQVSVSRKNESIQISVEDGGVGFNTAVLDTPFDRDTGFGLFSIRERIQYFGGKFKLRSNPGEGTQVTITVPIND